MHAGKKKSCLYSLSCFDTSWIKIYPLLQSLIQNVTFVFTLCILNTNSQNSNIVQSKNIDYSTIDTN